MNADVLLVLIQETSFDEQWSLEMSKSMEEIMQINTWISNFSSYL